MSQSKNRTTGRRASDRTESPEVRIVYRNQISKRSTIIISVIVIALIAAIIFINNYFSTDAKYMRLDVITVDDIAVDMNYFVKRVDISGSDPVALLGIIAKEKVILLVAPEYGIEISDEAIDQQIQEIARGESDTLSEDEFEEWYRQTLNESGLSDAEYRELVKANMIAGLIKEAISATMETAVEQIYVHTIMTSTETEALKAKGQLEAGADFATLAKEISIDGVSRDNGGDLGWMPGGVLDPQLEYEVWGQEIGVISEPIPFFDIHDPSNMEPVGWYLIKISDRADSREIDEKYLPLLEMQAFDAWFTEESKNHTIQYHGLHNGFDSEAYAWINYQLSKRE